VTTLADTVPSHRSASWVTARPILFRPPSTPASVDGGIAMAR